MLRRMSDKQRAKAEERFKSRLTEYIVAKGARPCTFYDHVLETVAGPLLITVYGSWIACRFDDVPAGLRWVGCNRFSGKWNHHPFDGTAASLDPDRVISAFGPQLERLLVQPPAAV